MALIFMDGFDHYATADILKKWSSSASVTIGAGSGRRGGGALVGVSGSGVSKTLPASATVVLGMAYKPTATALANRSIIEFSEGGILHVSVVLSTTGLLSVFRGNNTTGTLLATGTSVLTLGNFRYLELKATIHDSAGAVTLRIDGSDELVLTGVDTRNAGTGVIDSVLVGASMSGSYYWVIDDLYICDATGTDNNDFLGDVRIDTLLPSADGSYTGFTPDSGSAHWSRVADGAPDTTTYVTSATVGATDTYQFADLPAVTGTIMAVQVNNAALKDDSGARSIANVVRSGTTDEVAAAVALSTSQSIYSSIHERDPATAAAWTESGVNGAQFGVKVAL